MNRAPAEMPAPDPRAGMVAILVVLSLLAVFGVLMTSYSRRARADILAARQALDAVRAEQLARTGLVRALAAVQNTTEGFVYPYWSNQAPAFCVSMLASTGTAAAADVVRATDVDWIPAALHAELSLATNTCRWTSLIDGGGHTNGRVAWLVVNASGLVDVHAVGEADRTWSADPGELGLGPLTLVTPRVEVALSRTVYGVYATLPEALRLNTPSPGLDGHFSVYAFPPTMDGWFAVTNGLGSTTLVLAPAFNVNALLDLPCATQGTATAYATDPAFAAYQSAAETVFSGAGIPDAAAVAWNLVNYLDPDSLPQNGSPAPWRESHGVEATPLINEVIMREVAGTTNEHEFVIETWYPFDDTDGNPPTNISWVLQAGVFSNVPAALAESEIMTAAEPAWSFSAHLPGPGVIAATPLTCITSPASRRITFANPATNDPPFVPVSPARPVRLLARILEVRSTDGGPATGIVDEAWGYVPGAAEGNEGSLMRFDATGSLACVHVLANGERGAWQAGLPESPGGTNSIPASLADALPLFVRNGPMLNRAEVGFLARTPATNAGATATVELLSGPGGALLDRITVRATNQAAPTRINLNTQQRDVLDALFDGVPLRPRGGSFSNAVPFVPTPGLAQSILGAEHASFGALLAEAGVTTAVRTAVALAGAAVTDRSTEDVVRGIAELAGFRGNVLLVFVRAQAFAADECTAVAEHRALAVVYRDGYTGRWRVHRRHRLY